VEPQIASPRQQTEVNAMSYDDRDALEVLKAELDFLEKGGYGRSVKTPWQPTSIFQDSPSCLNLGDLERTHPCNECLLIDFVPAEDRNEDVPCHHIPLNTKGDTIDEIEWKEDQARLEETVKNWLRSKIDQLEQNKVQQRTA
jgi:hypothetical protein